VIWAGDGAGFGSDYWPMVGAVHPNHSGDFEVNRPYCIATCHINQKIKGPGEFPHQDAGFLLFALLL
jgi:hypothetical protein